MAAASPAVLGDVHLWESTREIESSRVARHCDTCGGELPIGERVRRVVWFDGFGSFGSSFSHSPDCKSQRGRLGYR